MDGAAALAWPLPDVLVTPKPDVQREVGELASTLAATIAEQRAAHDRLRNDLTATDARLEAIGTGLGTIQRDLAALCASVKELSERKPEASKIQWTSGAVWAIVATVSLILGAAYNMYQSAHAEAQENKQAIVNLGVKLEADKDVRAAEQRLRDYKEATETANLDRIEKLSQLNAAYITSLQRDQAQKR